MSDVKWLSYAEAAKRVGRSERAVKLWRRNGMPMGWRVGSDGQRERVVREDVLLGWFRDRLKASPVHQYRMRAAARERAAAEGMPEPEFPPIVLRPKKRDQVQDGSEAVEQPGHTPDERTAPETRAFDPLADMKPLRGGPEYGQLHEALKHDTPACRGIDAFTADRIDPDEIPVLAGICAGCDVLDQCRAFRDRNRPDIGFWAGAPASSTTSMRTIA